MDPQLRADQIRAVWLPQVNPRLTLLTTLPRAILAGPALAIGEPDPVAFALEGTYLDLSALPPVHSALLLGTDEATLAVGAVIVLDAYFEERVETARRLRDLLLRRRPKPSGLSDYRRRRLKLALRALDGSLDGAEYRAIAEALFSGVPQGPAFRDNSLRAQAIRLVRYGSQLMRGGYLDLLRPERRSSRRRR